MADKSIDQLNAAEKIYATDLFVLQQSGSAKKLTGQVLLNWLTAAADGHGGIQSITKLSTSGLVDTYRITLADTTTFDFAVNNGRGITGVSKTSTSGLVDTYTISYNNGTTSTITVTNGAKGDKGDNTYTWIKYASQEPTESSHSMGDIPDDWIGIYSGNASTAPTDWKQYKWYKIKGEQGPAGDDTPALEAAQTANAAAEAANSAAESAQEVVDTVMPDVTKLKQDLTEICSHFEQSLNLINPASITPGIVIDKDTGEEVSNAGYSITDYISVTPGAYAYKNIQYIAFYKEGNVFSRRVNKVAASQTTVKSGEVSVRVIGKIGTEETWRFNQGAIVVDEPYSEYPSLVNVDLSKLDIEPMATEALTDASGKTYRSLKERLDTESGKEIQHIKDPFSLPIRMGYWSAGGAFNANFQNAGFLLDVKAGSTIKCKTNDVQFQTRLAPASGTDAVYITYRSGDYTVPEDGTLCFSVRYTDERQIVNNSILDNIDIDLIVDGMDVKYSRNVYANRVIPAITHFHTLDNTGFNQDTPYDDIISAFDALCDGTFLKKTVLASVDIGDGITKDICQYRYSVTGNHKNNYPKVILIGSMHGHEKSATYGIYYMLREMIDNACETDMGLWLKSNVNMVIVPACNPYGWEHNIRFNANGVNINRNFGTYGWDEYLPTDESGNSTYNAWQYNAKGDAPCDQTETQAICRVLAENADAVACFDCHTNGLSTEAMYEVFALNLPYDFDCNEKSKKMNNCILDYRSYIKPFMDGNYGVPLTSPWYGSVGVGDEKPMLSTYCADSASIFGLLLEVTPGSQSGFLGDRLTKYTPEVVQLCGELTAFAVATIIGYEKQTGLIH